MGSPPVRRTLSENQRKKRKALTYLSKLLPSPFSPFVNCLKCAFDLVLDFWFAVPDLTLITPDRTQTLEEYGTSYIREMSLRQRNMTLTESMFSQQLTHMIPCVFLSLWRSLDPSAVCTPANILGVLFFLLDRARCVRTTGWVPPRSAQVPQQAPSSTQTPKCSTQITSSVYLPISVRFERMTD